MEEKKGQQAGKERKKEYEEKMKIKQGKHLKQTRTTERNQKGNKKEMNKQTKLTRQVYDLFQNLWNSKWDFNDV